jgi:hypothetical protein
MQISIAGPANSAELGLAWLGSMSGGEDERRNVAQWID